MGKVHKVRVADDYEGPWRSLRGKVGEVIQAPGWETLTPVEFDITDLWYTPAPGESRVFYFPVNDLQKEP